MNDRIREAIGVVILLAMFIDLYYAYLASNWLVVGLYAFIIAVIVFVFSIAVVTDVRSRRACNRNGHKSWSKVGDTEDDPTSASHRVCTRCGERVEVEKTDG